MKKIIMTMAAVSALSIGVPAAAQNMGFGAQSRVQQLQLQLQAGVQSGAISRREAMPLRTRLSQLLRLEQLYGRGGFTGRERADLQQRSVALRQEIRIASRDGNNGYGRDGRYDNDRDGRYDSDRDGRYDRDDDRRDGAWNDRDDNGRWDDRDNDGRGLIVGSRIGANVDILPAQYRDRYRDGGGFYYRYAGGNVYQVDARTNLIVRVIADRR